MDKLQLEDTVSADRKERIIFDPEAWRKSDKSGRKTSAITSRQNFDNEKFTRKAKSDDKEQVDEGTIQPNDTSKVEAGGPEQSDTISKDKQKKSNNPNIEFVTGTAMPNGSSSTAIGNAQNMGIKKISEQLADRALAAVKEEVFGEAYGRKDAYTRDYEHSTSGMGKRQSAAYHADGGANDEGHPPEKFKARSTMDRPHTVHIGGKPWKKFSNGHQAHAAARTLQAKGKDAHAIAHFNEEEETNMSKTYSQFIEELNESGYTVRKIEGTRYGGGKQTTHPEHDEDDEDSKPAEPVKRGRGRPAGSKSGANLKVTKGKSYGGIATHSLNLPNSNR